MLVVQVVGTRKRPQMARQRPPPVPSPEDGTSGVVVGVGSGQENSSSSSSSVGGPGSRPRSLAGISTLVATAESQSPTSVSPNDVGARPAHHTAVRKPPPSPPIQLNSRKTARVPPAGQMYSRSMPVNLHSEAARRASPPGSSSSSGSTRPSEMHANRLRARYLHTLRIPPPRTVDIPLTTTTATDGGDDGDDPATATTTAATDAAATSAGASGDGGGGGLGSLDRFHRERFAQRSRAHAQTHPCL